VRDLSTEEGGGRDRRPPGDSFFLSLLPLVGLCLGGDNAWDAWLVVVVRGGLRRGNG